jgi:hypothetical protein
MASDFSKSRSAAILEGGKKKWKQYYLTITILHTATLKDY